MKLRDSTTLSAEEKDAIRSDYARIFRGDVANASDEVARMHGTSEACVRRLILDKSDNP